MLCYLCQKPDCSSLEHKNRFALVEAKARELYETRAHIGTTESHKQDIAALTYLEVLEAARNQL
jgi:hypothetical protein